MAIMTPDAGSLKILDKYLNENNLTLKLFTNDYTPVESSLASDFTEATGGGYAPLPLTAGGWTVGLDGSGIPTATYSTQVFSFTGALALSAAIHGVYVVDADGVCIFSERAAATFTPATAGEAYAVIPQLQLSKGMPA